MADYTDTKVSQLVINNLTQEKFEELKAKGELQDDQIYCTPDSGNGFDLFDSKWADHILNDPSWLRADNFSWHSGDVYKSAYEHLHDEIFGREGMSETIADITVWFVQADDGHKVCPATEEANVQALYEKTGVAWYYIIDEANKRFKLPRTKFGFVGLRDEVGKFVSAGLPNIEGKFGYYLANVGSLGVNTAKGAFGGTIAQNLPTATKTGTETTTTTNTQVDFTASRSSSIYGGSNTVQPPATQMYLYFYVGDWIKDKELVDVGTIAEELNNKADIDLSNVTDSGKSLFIHNSAVSGTYEDLPVGAHGTYYTMPEDGWLVIISTNSQTANSSIGLRNASNEIINQTFISNTNAVYGAAIPVAKGQSVQGYYYGQDINTLTIRFVYLVGNKNKKA